VAHLGFDDSTLGKLIVSLSNGSLCLLQPSETGFDFVTESWHAHDYEPWIAAWNYWDTNVIFSGLFDTAQILWVILVNIVLKKRW